MRAGQPEEGLGELELLILEAPDYGPGHLEAGKLFCVVTPSRGFQRGTPIPYHRDEVTGVIDFASEADATAESSATA